METKFAGFWLRLVADIIDSIILSIASWFFEYVILYSIYMAWSWYQTSHGLNAGTFSSLFNAFWLQGLNIGFYGVLAFPYYVWGHFRWGTTLGKRPFRIYVVDAQTLTNISMKQSIIRFFSYGLSYLLFLCGFLMAGFHPKKQGLHDLLARTVSIRKDKS